MNGLSLYILFIVHTAFLLVQTHCIVIANSEHLHFIAQDQRVKRWSLFGGRLHEASMPKLWLTYPQGRHQMHPRPPAGKPWAFFIQTLS